MKLVDELIKLLTTLDRRQTDAITCANSYRDSDFAVSEWHSGSAYGHGWARYKLHEIVKGYLDKELAVKTRKPKRKPKRKAKKSKRGASAFVGVCRSVAP